MRVRLRLPGCNHKSAWSRLICCIVTLLVVLPGCGGVTHKVGEIPVFPTRGIVTFNGEPLEAAVVTLIPTDENKKQPASQGVTNEMGEFVLSTYNPNDGAPEGEYNVTVSCENRNGKKVAGEFPELLPVRYQSPMTSRVKIKIEDGDNDLDPLELVK